MTTTKLDTFTEAYIEAMLWAESAELGRCENEDCEAIDRDHVMTDQNSRCANCGGEVWATDRSFQDCGFDAEMIAPESLERIIADCTRFQNDNAELLDSWAEFGQDTERAGHDFWLTRRGHGAGFWDRFSRGTAEYGLGELLTVVSETFGDQSPYVGDDGKIHLG